MREDTSTVKARNKWIRHVKRNFLLQEKKTSSIPYKTFIIHIYYIEITI